MVAHTLRPPRGGALRSLSGCCPSDRERGSPREFRGRRGPSPFPSGGGGAHLPAARGVDPVVGEAPLEQEADLVRRPLQVPDLGGGAGPGGDDRARRHLVCNRVWMEIPVGPNVATRTKREYFKTTIKIIVCFVYLCKLFWCPTVRRVPACARGRHTRTKAALGNVAAWGSWADSGAAREWAPVPHPLPVHPHWASMPEKCVISNPTRHRNGRGRFGNSQSLPTKKK